MVKKLKSIPRFKSEKEEREFWQKADSTDYLDWSQAERASFPNLKLTSRPVTIRLPQALIERLKVRAHKLDLPYQSYIKQVLFKEVATT
ncbi:MAG: BrnA antitoxin family protein [Patescibacteria group bacterium]